VSDDLTYTLDEIVKRTGFDKRTTSYYVQKGLLPKVGRRGPKTRYPKVFLDRLLFIKMIREQQDRGEIGNLTLANIRDILDHVRPDTIADMVNGRESLHGVATQKMALPPVPAAAATQVETAEAAPEPPHRQILHDEKSDVIQVPIDDPGEVSSSDDVEVDVSLPDRNNVARFAVPRPAQDGPAEEAVIQRQLGHEGAAEEDASENVVPAERTVGSNGFAEIDPEDRLGWSLARLQKTLDKPRRHSGTTESWHRARVTPELTISARSLSENDAYLLDAVARLLKKMLWQAWEE
jgi:DNA-binding transcriptional MerR regulator